MAFSDEIKNIRMQLFMSQVDFAHELGISFSTVNRWETGKTRPNFKTLKKINDLCKANGFKVPAK